jgi:hypothetical protein
MPDHYPDSTAFCKCSASPAANKLALRWHQRTTAAHLSPQSWLRRANRDTTTKEMRAPGVLVHDHRQILQLLLQGSPRQHGDLLRLWSCWLHRSHHLGRRASGPIIARCRANQTAPVRMHSLRCCCCRLSNRLRAGSSILREKFTSSRAPGRKRSDACAPSIPLSRKFWPNAESFRRHRLRPT